MLLIFCVFLVVFVWAHNISSGHNQLTDQTTTSNANSTKAMKTILCIFLAPYVVAYSHDFVTAAAAACPCLLCKPLVAKFSPMQEQEYIQNIPKAASEEDTLWYIGTTEQDQMVHFTALATFISLLLLHPSWLLCTAEQSQLEVLVPRLCMTRLVGWTLHYWDSF